MSCVFCEEKKTVHRSAVGQGCRTMMTNLSILFGGTDENDEVDGIFYNDEENNPAIGFDNSSGEYAAAFVDINYCPICGKRLRTEVKND